MTHKMRATAAVLALGLLLAPLSGCAPEPGTVNPDGRDLTEKVEPEGGSWQEENPDEVFDKQVELPADFPAAFVLPEGAVIDDAGLRGVDSWFVVLRAEDQPAADALWDAVVSSGGFTVSDETETGDGGRAATLTGTGLEVAAVTLPTDSAGVLLSYDLTAVLG